jgi:hypothetical protein
MQGVGAECMHPCHRLCGSAYSSSRHVTQHQNSYREIKQAKTLSASPMCTRLQHESQLQGVGFRQIPRHASSRVICVIMLAQILWLSDNIGGLRSAMPYFHMFHTYCHYILCFMNTLSPFFYPIASYTASRVPCRTTIWVCLHRLP